MTTNTIGKVGINFSIPSLLMKAREIAELVLRDIESFKKYDVDNERLDRFNKTINDFSKSSVKADVVLEVKSLNESIIKKQIKEELKENLKNLLFIAKSVYNDHPFLKNYSIKLAKLSEIELAFYCEMLARLTKINIADFHEFSQTEECCNNLITLQEKFKIKYLDLVQKTLKRKEATIIRWQIADEIYKEMAYFCELGKMIWANDQLNFKYYVLYSNYLTKKANKEKTKNKKTKNKKEDAQN